MRVVWLVACSICAAQCLIAQCPDRSKLNERILQLKASNVPEAHQIKELVPYATALEKCAIQHDTVRMLLLQRLGALHYLTGRFNDAVSYTLNAINVVDKKSISSSDTAFLIKAYYFLHFYYDSLHLIHNRINVLDSSIHYALSYSRPDHEILLYNLAQRSLYAFDIGDYERCVRYSSLGESLTNKFASPASKHLLLINFFNNRINAMIAMNELERSKRELQDKIDEFIAAGQENDCGPFYNLLSKISRYRYHYDDALKYLNKSLLCNQRSNDMLSCKQSVNHIGYIYLNPLNDPRKALSYFTKALQFNSSIPEQALDNKIENVNVLVFMAIAYSKMNLFDSSMAYFEKAFGMIERGLNEYSLNNMPLEKFVSTRDVSYVIRLITEKGEAYARRYHSTKQDLHLTEAIRIFKIADRAFTRVKTVHTEMQSKLAWRSDARTLYEYAIDACYAGNRFDEAFYFFERSRSILLNDQIFENRRMSDNDVNTRYQIETKIGQLTRQLSITPPNDKEYAEIQKNILLLDQQKDRIVGPKRSSDTAGLTLKQFRNDYDFKNESLLEIFSGDSAVFIFLLNQNHVQLKKINKERFNKLSAAFNEYVGDPVRSNSNFPDFVAVANELYRLVFDTLNIKGSRLIVSPDDNNFPFEALVTEARNGKNPVYLVQSTSVVYTYSAGFLLLDFNLRNERSVPLVLGMAPVRFPGNNNLADLVGSDASLNKITASFKSSQVISGKQATRTQFIKHFHKYRIVQLYTHGTASGDAGIPVIYFADSSLNLFDLLPQSKTATQLIVLSACETGIGEYFKGEGVFSFNRAFAQAGIPSSMVNLWSVDNQSTYKLTELFYKYLFKGSSFDEALRLAKVEFLSSSQRERSLPFYWAAMVFTGQPSHSMPTAKFPWILTAGITIALLSLVIIAFRRFSYKAPYR